MDLNLINAIDSITEDDYVNEESDDEFIIPEELLGEDNELIEECKHEWRTDNVKRNEVCIKCGITRETDNYIDGGDIDDNTIAIEANQFNIKGIGRKMRRFYLWHESPSYVIKSFNEDLNTIKKICDKVGIIGMIANDAKLIYKRFKEITGFGANRTISKSATKKQRIAMIQRFKDEDEEFKKQMTISNCRLRGDSKTGLLCACIYYACYKNGFCVICNVLADAINIKPKYVHKGCNALMQIRDLGDSKMKMLVPIVCMPYPVNFTDSVCDRYEKLLGKEINEEHRDKIKICMLNSQRYDLIINHNPHSFAIGIVFLYLAENKIMSNKYSKKDIADFFGICQPTLNTTFKELVFNKDKVMNFEYDDKELRDVIDNKKCEIDNERFEKFFEGIDSNRLKIDLDVIKAIE